MLCRVHGLKDSGEIKEALYSLLFLEKYVFWGTIRKKKFLISTVLKVSNSRHAFGSLDREVLVVFDEVCFQNDWSWSYYFP